MPARRAPTVPRGRLPAAARAARESAILDVALDELVSAGPAGLSMTNVATQAGASKETLYAWFGNRDGLIEALIRRNADVTVARVSAALSDAESAPAAVLTDFAANLLGLLVSPASIALNRAGMTSPPLAQRLLEHGRFSVGPVVEAYLAGLNARDQLAVTDPSDAFELFYGLVVRDTQIRVLLGEPAPSATAIAERAAHAVEQFIHLCRRPTEPEVVVDRAGRRGRSR